MHAALEPTAHLPLRQSALAASLLLGFPLMSGAGLAAAQTSSTPVNPPVSVLSEVSVTATAPDDATTEGTGSYATHAVTIGKGERQLREVPQSVSTVTRERMDDQNLRTLGDALGQTTGITVQQSNSFQSTFSSRGFTLDKVQLDGVPTQTNDGNFLMQSDLSMYDRVEVLRGPDGLFNGQGAAGGTVNLVRKRPTAERQFGADVSIGSWQNYRGTVDVSGRLNESGTLRGRVVGAYEDREYFYDIADSDKKLFYGILEYDLAPSTVVGAGLSYERAAMTPFYGGLPRFSDGRDLGLPRDTYLNAAWSRVRIEKTTAFADLTHRFNEDWKMRVAATHVRESNHDRSGSVFGAVDPVTNTGPTVSAFDANLEGRQTGADATLEGRFDALGRSHDVILGANVLQRESTTLSRLMRVDDPLIDPFEFDPYDYRDFPTELARAPTHNTIKSRNWGAYGALRFSVADPVKVILGARYSRYDTSTFNRVSSQYTVQHNEKAQITPYGAITFDLDDRWTAYASYAEIFRVQANRYTVDGTPLRPATGSNYEVGLKGMLYDGRLNTALALFRIDESDREVVDPNAPTPCPFTPTGTGSCYVNGGKVRSQGLDAEISGELARGWNVYAGYTFNTTKFLRDTAANEGTVLSSFTPRHILRVWTDYRLPGRWNALTLGGGVNVQSSTYKTRGAQRFEQSGYAIWSAQASYRIDRNLSLALNVNNIFDKHYYSTLGDERGSNWYGEPRSVTLTLRARY